MSDAHPARAIDRWLKYAAIIGPFLGFTFGICTGAWGTYQAFKDEDRRVVLIESWKDKQDDFNRNTVDAIARLQEVVKRIK